MQLHYLCPFDNCVIETFAFPLENYTLHSFILFFNNASLLYLYLCSTNKHSCMIIWIEYTSIYLFITMQNDGKIKAWP